MKKKLLATWISISLCITFYAVADKSAKQDVVIVGTGSSAELLRIIAHSFMDENPDISIVIPESIGSGGGIKAVGNDEYLMGRIARDIKESEKDYGLTVIPVANIPIGFFVNAEIPLTQITPEQACGIFDGTIRRWETLCDKEGYIRIIRREEGDSTLTALRKSLPCFSDLALTPRSKLMFSDPATIEECASVPGTITFGSWVNVRDNPKVRMLALNGIPPFDNNYPLTSPLRLIYKKQNYKGPVKKIVDYITSGKANRVIRDAGGIPTQPVTE